MGICNKLYVSSEQSRIERFIEHFSLSIGKSIIERKEHSDTFSGFLDSERMIMLDRISRLDILPKIILSKYEDKPVGESDHKRLRAEISNVGNLNDHKKLKYKIDDKPKYERESNNKRDKYRIDDTPKYEITDNAKYRYDYMENQDKIRLIIGDKMRSYAGKTFVDLNNSDIIKYIRGLDTEILKSILTMNDQFSRDGAINVNYDDTGLWYHMLELDFRGVMFGTSRPVSHKIDFYE